MNEPGTKIGAPTQAQAYCIADGLHLGLALCGREIGKPGQHYDSVTKKLNHLLVPHEPVFNGIDQWYLNAFSDEPYAACRKCLAQVVTQIERDLGQPLG